MNTRCRFGRLRWYSVIAAFSLALTIAQPANATLIVDTLEDIGADGTAVAGRNVGGVTVTITPSGGTMGARTYGNPNNVDAFTGAAGTDNNDPLNPANVSGSRFISTSDGALLDAAQPISFSFDTPLSSFGLTTLDLLEGGQSSSSFVTLEAFDGSNNSLDIQTRAGTDFFGSSGLDLDWLLSSASSDISKAVLSGAVDGSTAGYGIDDLVVEVPDVITATTLGFFADEVIFLSNLGPGEDGPASVLGQPDDLIVDLDGGGTTLRFSAIPQSFDYTVDVPLGTDGVRHQEAMGQIDKASDRCSDAINGDPSCLRNAALYDRNLADPRWARGSCHGYQRFRNCIRS